MGRGIISNVKGNDSCPKEAHIVKACNCDPASLIVESGEELRQYLSGNMD